MLKNSSVSNLQERTFELIFLLIIDFFSIISFWVAIPLSVFIILVCKENIKEKINVTFYRTILILSSLCILLSIWIQIALSIATKDSLGGVRFTPMLFQKLAEILSIVG